MRKKTWLLLSLVVLLIMPIQTIFAKEKTSERVIVDPIEIKKIAEDHNLEIPEGYHIEEIKYTDVYFPDHNYTRYKNDENIQPYWFDSWTLKNVKKQSGDYYFPDSPLVSDWAYGPSNFKHIYKESVTASFSSSVGVKASVVEATVGFEVSGSKEFSREYSVEVPRGKKVNIKVYGMYEKYTFDVYKNDKYEGKGKAFKPIGLKFEQIIYSK